MPKNADYTIPEGMTAEEFAEAAHNYVRMKAREDYHKNPEKWNQYRLNTAIRYAQRNGYTCVRNLPTPPWDDLQKRSILHALECAIAGRVFE